MSGVSDELVSQFMAVTGSSDGARATSYLEMSGGNLETAVGLYMEHQQGSGGGGGFGASAAAAAEPEIRAPDQTQTMRLMDDNVMHQDPSFQLMNAMMEEQLQQTAFAPRAALSDVRAAVNAAASEEKENSSMDQDMGMMDVGDDADDDEDDDDVEIVAAPQPAGLSDMFAPPTNLMHTAGGFQGARAMARDARRWLLVNIQRDSEFSSHALNRDVWRDELIENLVREGFIFWQQMDISPEGRTYTERYQVMDYPHVGIIDPRTGRLMWRKEGWTQENPLTAETFAEYAMDFCSRNSFNRPPQAPRPSVAKRPMTEDEQLQAAMKASLQQQQDDDSNSVEYVMDSDEEEDEVQAEDSKPAAPEKSPHDDLLAMAIGDEPAAGARLQLRMPDGKRVVRRFNGSDTVKTIYAFVAQTNEEARSGKEFVLMAGFPPRDLANNDIENDTIEGCKLSGQAVTVRWKV